MMICQTSKKKKTQKTKRTRSVRAACISVLPGPESSPPTQTGPHVPLTQAVYTRRNLAGLIQRRL